MSSENYEENGYGLDLDLLIISNDITGIFDILGGVGTELKCPIVGLIFFIAFYGFMHHIYLMYIYKLFLCGDIG
jgi:hypothetical protein